MKTNKKSFKAVYKCWNPGCNAIMVKEGLTHFNSVYQFECPFCKKKMKLAEMKGYEEYLEQQKENQNQNQNQ